MEISQAEIKRLRKLLQKKYRKSERRALIEGWRTLKEAVEAGIGIDYVALVRGSAKLAWQESVLDAVQKRNIPIKDTPSEVLSKICTTVNPQGVLAVVQQHRYSMEAILNKGTIVVAADGISDPGNLGTLIRSCAWFGVDGLLLSDDCVELYNEKVVRASAGAVFRIAAAEDANLEEALETAKKLGFETMVAVPSGGVDYSAARYGSKLMIVFGNEARGVRGRIRQSADIEVTIPRFGPSESLNVAISSGIILAHLRVTKQK